MKKYVTIHQPEHFPYIGHWQKLAVANELVFLDTVQYRKNYFQNRNKLQSGWFTVPVEKKANSKAIRDVLVSKDPKWRKKISKQLQQQLKIDVSSVYQDSEYLADINYKAYSYIVDSLEDLEIDMSIVNRAKRVSEMSIDSSLSGSDLLLEICLARSASVYISGPSGRDYLNVEKFNRFGIDVKFFEPEVEDDYSILWHLAKDDPAVLEDLINNSGKLKDS